MLIYKLLGSLFHLSLMRLLIKIDVLDKIARNVR